MGQLHSMKDIVDDKRKDKDAREGSLDKEMEENAATQQVKILGEREGKRERERERERGGESKREKGALYSA